MSGAPASWTALGVVRSATLLAMALATLSLTARAQRGAPHPQTWTVSRTSWGDPDFQGIWNYATMTPLERPRELADKDVLSADEAAAYEAQTNARQSATNNTAGPDWWDPVRVRSRTGAAR